MNSTADAVICGAGMAGVSTAYQLSAKNQFGKVVLVDERAPLSLTSDKSTEAYRNWWPGPGTAMVDMMNRSIDLMEEMADESGNVFHLNQRGYLYVTSQPDQLDRLKVQAQEASSLGAGPVRIHDNSSTSISYQPNTYDDFRPSPPGADLIESQELIQELFPYLDRDVIAVLHVRRAGWLSAQQYGMYLLENARAKGTELVQAKVLGVEINSGKVASVELSNGDRISTPIFVNAAGPFLAEVGGMLDVSIPVHNQLHLKASIEDREGVLPREAPLIICADSQELEWTAEEQNLLSGDPDSTWLLGMLPGGAHTRPEGGDTAETILILWDLNEDEMAVEIPPVIDLMYAEIAMRGLVQAIPGFEIYLARMPKPYVDGGYYTKTRENRPLACPLPIEGGYVFGAMAGYGIMASAALSELVAAHITKNQLPTYAPAFDLQRYEDTEYQRLLADWGNSWQL